LFDRLPAALLGEKEVVKAGELLVQRRLLVTIGKVKADLGAVEKARAGTNRVISQSNARGSDRPKQLVLLCASTERVVEPVLVVALDLRGVVIVPAIQCLIKPECYRFLRSER
jgi:hypothetical protein